MNCQVEIIASQKSFFCTFVNASHSHMYRRYLWKDLRIHKRFIANKPWVVMGDFKVSLRHEESTAGPSWITIAMDEFKECI